MTKHFTPEQRFIALQSAAETVCVEPLPEHWESMEEAAQNTWLRENAYDIYDGKNPSEIFAVIDSRSDLFLEACERINKAQPSPKVEAHKAAEDAPYTVISIDSDNNQVFSDHVNASSFEYACYVVANQRKSPSVLITLAMTGHRFDNPEVDAVNGIYYPGDDGIAVEADMLLEAGLYSMDDVDVKEVFTGVPKEKTDQ